jgi:L-amino acid N-acyltransferase YncA
MDDLRFEEMQEKYLPEVLEIYNYYVVNTTATFHAKPLSLDEMRELVFFENPKYKTFVMIENTHICGYVLLTQHKKREAYDGTAEVTVYLKPNSIGKGLGSLAIKYMEEVAKQHQIHVLVATICGENTRSIKLFDKNGYAKCAHYREVGEKFGQLLDVVAYQKIL